MLYYIIGWIMALSIGFSILWVIAVLGKTLIGFLFEPISMIVQYILNR